MLPAIPGGGITGIEEREREVTGERGQEFTRIDKGFHFVCLCVVVFALNFKSDEVKNEDKIAKMI